MMPLIISALLCLVSGIRFVSMYVKYTDKQRATKAKQSMIVDLDSKIEEFNHLRRLQLSYSQAGISTASIDEELSQVLADILSVSSKTGVKVQETFIKY